MSMFSTHYYIVNNKGEFWEAYGWGKNWPICFHDKRSAERVIEHCTKPEDGAKIEEGE